MSRLVACRFQPIPPQGSRLVRLNPASHHIGVFDRIVEVNGQAGLGKDMVTQQQRQGIPKSMGPWGFTKIIWDVGG